MKIKNSFAEQCYAFLICVPKGKVTTYKTLAEALGTKSYRAVGNAMNRNPRAPRVPCHRVVSSNGSLGGYTGGIRKKIALLQKEGVVIEHGKIDLEKFGFVFK